MVVMMMMSKTSNFLKLKLSCDLKNIFLTLKCVYLRAPSSHPSTPSAKDEGTNIWCRVWQAGFLAIGCPLSGEGGRVFGIQLHQERVSYAQSKRSQQLCKNKILNLSNYPLVVIVCLFVCLCFNPLFCCLGKAMGSPGRLLARGASQHHHILVLRFAAMSYPLKP